MYASSDSDGSPVMSAPPPLRRTSPKSVITSNPAICGRVPRGRQIATTEPTGQSSNRTPRPTPRPTPPPPARNNHEAGSSNQSLKKGGKVKRTGKAFVHKNEVVLPVSVVNKLKKLMK